MPYIGNTSPSRFVSNRAASVYSGDGSTTAFTLEQAVVQDEDILVSVDGVIQEPSVAYAVSNGTTLTFTGAPSSNSGNNIFVYYLASQVGTVGHPSNQALNATTGTFSGAITGGGLLTTGGNVVIPDAGNIGSASDTDAISIASNGVVTFSQTPVNAGGGKLLQVVTAEIVTSNATNSTSYTGTDLQVNITPSATSSHVLVHATFDVGYPSDNQSTKFTLYRDSTDLNPHAGTGRDAFTALGATGDLSSGEQTYSVQQRHITFFDDAISTTSQVTYRVYYKQTGGTGYFNMNQNGDAGSKPTATIVAMEIGA